MKRVHLIVTVELDDDTHPGCLESLNYIEFADGNMDGWADLDRDVGEPDENSIHSQGPMAKLIDAKVIELEEVDEPRPLGLDG